jgi:hypothetical protein
MNMLVSHSYKLFRRVPLTRRQIEAARGAAGRQFVFITPQSMGNIKDSSLDVKIIRYLP